MKRCMLCEAEIESGTHCPACHQLEEENLEVMEDLIEKGELDDELGIVDRSEWTF